MRKSIQRHRNIALSALAAAGLSAWGGVPAARGDFSVSVVDMGLQTLNSVSYHVWVLAATNDGLNNTGSDLDVVQAIVDTPGDFNSTVGAIYIDIEKNGRRRHEHEIRR